MICITPEIYHNLTEGELVQKFEHGSGENMDLITVDRACRAVDAILAEHE
jgi:hypothetical protein